MYISLHVKYLVLSNESTKQMQQLTLNLLAPTAVGARINP